MVGVLLETASRRKILLITVVAFLALVTFFVLGGTKVSTPATAAFHIATVCNATGRTWNEWYNRPYYDGSGAVVKDKNAPCQPVSIGMKKTADSKSTKAGDSYVFSVHMPHPERIFHKLHQFLIVSMNAQIEEHSYGGYAEGSEKRMKECTIHFTTKVGYRSNRKEKWTEFATSKEKRPLRCILTRYKGEYSDQESMGYYTCEDMHFMEIGSTPHPFYLINLKFEATEDCFGVLDSLQFVAISQNPSYTFSWFIAKTVVTPFLIAALVFFIKRVRSQPRPPILLEKITGALGISLLFLVFPIDWFSLAINMPYMLLFSDIRQGQFYAFLLCFWCIFVGEHILDQQKRGLWKCYKWQLGAISIGCTSLLIFDLIERGVQLRNPFHTIWKKDSGETLAKVFIILAAICAGLFLLFFIVLIFKVFRHMSIKGQAIPAMKEARQMHYQGVIYRFKVLLGVTLFCVVSTVVCFILDQVNEGHWKFIEDNVINDVVKVSSAMHFGTFGLWNIYVICILILYSPAPFVNKGSVRYRVGEAGGQEDMPLDGAGSDDSTSLPDGSVSVVYQMSGQHIKE